MPFSDEANREFVKQFVADNGIRSVLDIGAGSGTYSDLLRDQLQYIDGIEIWEPYVREFDLPSKYNLFAVADARDKFRDFYMYDLNVKPYDLVIFGDVMEHMSEEDAVEMWTLANRVGNWKMISSPIIHYPQGAEHGNPYEAHVQDNLTAEKIRELFGPFEFEEVYAVTGTFIARSK
jgi:2-polyprenyl-3-methyl-5-hydroxy-6-metoxy-1,4-benzoquinol methylase